MTLAQETVQTKGRVLLVDDDVQVLRAYAQALTLAGYSVTTASDGRVASDLLNKNAFDVIVSDISMPDMDGLQLLRAVRSRDADVPVILVTGNPSIGSAAKAVEYGALRYLLKPISPKMLDQALEGAIRLYKLALLKREAMMQVGHAGAPSGDLAGLEASFDRALGTLWMAYQPIVSWSQRRVFAYEALVRTAEPTVPHPGVLLETAERLNRLPDLGRAVRTSVAETLSGLPDAGTIFINLHTRDLLDEALYSPEAPLSKHSSRVVLEITERAALEEVKNVRSRVATLREMGFRIAIDDLGAGYAGLASFAQLEPEVIKFDMCLVRDIHKEPTRRKLLQSMTALCREMGLLVIAEGVETVEERDTLVEMGCDLLQGFLFAKPDKPLPQVNW